MKGAALVAQRCAETDKPEVIEHPTGQAFIPFMGRLFTPGIEAPAHTGQPMLRVIDKGRAGVAAPAVVDRLGDQFNARAAQGDGTGKRRRVDNHLHRLKPRNGIGYPREVLLHLRQRHAPSVLPQRLVMRPDHPGRRMLGPLGGHPPPQVFNFIHLHDKYL